MMASNVKNDIDCLQNGSQRRPGIQKFFLLTLATTIGDRGQKFTQETKTEVI